MRRAWPLSIVIGVLLNASVHAQGPAASSSQPAPPSFEVTSVRENNRSVREGGIPNLQMHPSGRFVATSTTLMRLILVAYDVRSYQVVGGPDWIRQDRFDVAAQAPEDFEQGEYKAMLRRLLEDRFGLVVRNESRQMPTYLLEWASRAQKPGRWLRRPSAECENRPPAMPGDAPSDRSSSNGRRAECSSMFGFTGVGWIWIRHSSLSNLLGFLGAESGRPVVDKTGLTGLWDVDLRFSPQPGSELPVIGNGGTASASEGSIFTAVREQLGLKLTPANGDVDVLAIERVARPEPD